MDDPSFADEITALEAIYENRVSCVDGLLCVSLEDFSLTFPLGDRSNETSIQLECASLSRAVRRAIIEKLSLGQGFFCCISDAEALVQEEIARVQPNESGPNEETSDERHIAQMYKFHHIFSEKKKETMYAMAKELHLNGGMLVGKPGVAVVSGPEGDVLAWTRAVRQLRWQAMALAAEMEVANNAHEKRAFDFVHFSTMAPFIAHLRDSDLDDFTNALFS